ncbi:MAG: bifunctional demethylmenaquinone methyltransferase/2-methoxy-6-polyprenyl-1,4-benzoquinol methylase UbiE [Saprospiraceae bacterium]|nr:bifunctional demethylmenaquinone methyltransferase/2-methoxy-6-polyprenyl-1,4-benzoquinol methylase UbiE [Saprospiraceae bacterium]
MSLKEVKSESIKPYDEIEDKKGQVSSMFNNIAKYYDSLNRILSLGIDKRWRKKTIALLLEDKPQNILDVATGTADLALEANKQLKPKKITGVDISEKMLEIGQKKIIKAGLENVISLHEGDSENLPFEDNTFDAAIVAFGVRNFANVQAGLKEMVRVLQKDSKIVVLEFSRPTMFPFKQGFNLYFKYILPFIGRLTSKDKKAYGYLYESVQAFPEGEDFLDLLTNIGLKNTSCKKLSLGICTIYSAVK